MKPFILSGVISFFFLWGLGCNAQNNDNNQSLQKDPDNKEIRMNSGKKMQKPEYIVKTSDNHIQVIVSHEGKKITRISSGEMVSEEKQKGGSNEK